MTKQEHLEPIKSIRLLTVPELAAYLSVSTTAIYRYVQLGMPHLRVPTSEHSKRTPLRFEIDKVREWLTPRD